MTKKIAILVDESYQVLEVWYPLYRLREAGFEVVLIGNGTRDTFPSKEGYPCKVDRSIEQVAAKDFDAVIIPGGWAPDFLRRYPKIVQFVKDLNAAGKLIASICHGGWMLVSADCCRGKKATCFFAIKDDIIAAGARYVDEETVVDGNLITARKPDDLPRFVKEIINKLQ
ncbi:MAG: type 1 glutamine amidotransferase [Candidatus Omnitrophica bacterium]|nr:type 1 glutamine amidotransferase [Candidatus Omnitrophota bacterium]